MRKIYQSIASKIQARANCAAMNPQNTEWEKRHKNETDDMITNYLPSGSGFDSGTRLDWDRSTGEKLVFITSFHHMDENGYYDGWTEHTVTVRASLTNDFDLTISGRDRNDIKEYIADAFRNALDQNEPAPRPVESAAILRAEGK